MSVLRPVALALCATLGLGCLSFQTNAPIELDASTPAPGFVDARTRVEVVSTMVGGKNLFIPSTIVFTEGEGRTLSFFNTTDQPHGMIIPDLGIQVVLPPQEEYLVELPPLVGGHVHDLQCHLHPPHRGAAIVVLPAAGAER